jgi:VanZ family protein
MVNNWRLSLAVVAYVVLIFLVSSIPSLTVPGSRFLFTDKIAHLVEYSLLGALLYRAFGGRLGHSRWLELLFIVVIGASVGALDEVYQSFVPGRVMSVYDWSADVIGTTLGVLAMRRWRPAVRKEQRP